MKKLVEKRWVRVLATVLFAVFLLLAVFFHALVQYGRSDGWYHMGNTEGVQDTLSCIIYIDNASYYVGENVRWEEDLTLDGLGSYAGAAYSYVIRDEEGNITADTRTEKSVFVASHVNWIKIPDGMDPELVESKPFYVDGYVNLPVDMYDGCYAEYALFRTFFSVRYLLAAAEVVSILLGVVCLLVLCAGQFLRGKEGRLPKTLALPWDVVLLGFIAVALFVNVVFVNQVLRFLDKLGSSGLFFSTVDSTFNFLTLVLVISLALWYLAGQLGAKLLWERLFLRRILRIIPREALVIAAVIIHILLLWQSTQYYAYDAYVGDPLMIILYGVDILLAVVLIRNIAEARTIRKAAQEVAGGNLSYKTNTKKLHFIWKSLGNNLNRLGDGMAKAVEDQMRSERMKTELITNVSHDLKTPLTSLINYIEFLKAPDLSEEARAEYLEILDKQSAKLKKLTEDVVEASKAASGAVTVHMETINVVELLDQVVGEFLDRLYGAGVAPVLDVPEQASAIQADSTLLGRVLENLITNVVKYAQPDTRAYFDLTEDGEILRITVKNISRDPLNISADELMERFVRGDSSRHSEGSGLGLSIAKSLTELMGGTLALTLDGDLFKAELLFPLKREEESEKTETSTVE